MASLDALAIERKLDRIRSLGREELRLEWRRLYHSDAPKISRGHRRGRLIRTSDYPKTGY
jgi:hypothetical protein